MSDEVKQPEAEHKTHVWYFRIRRDHEPEQVEFGTSIDKQEASNRIAKMLGHKTLPSEVVVSWRQLEKLAPELAAKPEVEPEEKKK